MLISPGRFLEMSSKELVPHFALHLPIAVGPVLQKDRRVDNIDRVAHSTLLLPNQKLTREKWAY